MKEKAIRVAKIVLVLVLLIGPVLYGYTGLVSEHRITKISIDVLPFAIARAIGPLLVRNSLMLNESLAKQQIQQQRLEHIEGKLDLYIEDGCQ